MVNRTLTIDSPLILCRVHGVSEEAETEKCAACEESEKVDLSRPDLHSEILFVGNALVIINGTALCITQSIVGLGDVSEVLEAFWSLVRVVLSRFRQVSVSDLLRICFLANTQSFIETWLYLRDLEIRFVLWIMVGRKAPVWI